MSDEMALSDNVGNDDAKVNGDETEDASAVKPEAASIGAPAEPDEPPPEDPPAADPAKGIATFT